MNLIIFIFVVCIALLTNSVYTNTITIFILFGSIWVPQIITNIKYNNQGESNLKFVIITSINSLYTPMYMKF